MNKTLVRLNTQRTRAILAIKALEVDLNNAPIERKLEVAEEIAFNQGKLYDISRDIEIEELNELWDESNISNKPKTIILKEN